MSREPLVSIIIAIYNAETMIQRCLQSCFSQVYPNIEIIIVDNNSTDDSIAIARKLASTNLRRVIFTNCQEQGVSYARNHGFTQASGEYIQWLDADDELTPNKIALQVAALELDPNSDVAYGDWEWCFYQQQQCQFRLAFILEQYNDYLLQVLQHNWQPPHNYLLRRQAAMRLQELRAWNPHTQLSTDREYYTIAAIIGLHFLYVPQALVHYNYWSSTQMSRGSSYVLRVECHRQMFLRFIEIAAMQPQRRFIAQHWLKLKQNWDLWELAPVKIVQKTDASYFLEHRHTQSGIAINEAEATLVCALHKVGGVYTLEEHSQRIVYLLWQHIIQQPGSDKVNVTAELSRWLGIEHSYLPQSSAHSPPQQQALINAIPWYAPLFGEQRLAVFNVLDKLRINGMLSQKEGRSQKYARLKAEGNQMGIL